MFLNINTLEKIAKALNLNRKHEMFLNLSAIFPVNSLNFLTVNI